MPRRFRSVTATFWAYRTPIAGRCAAGRWRYSVRSEPRLTPEQETLGNRSVTEITAYLKDLIADRRQHPGNPQHDVLTRLIQGEEGERLSEVELLQNCVFMPNAGHVKLPPT